MLSKQALENVLCHPSAEVRSLALAVLVSSASTSRPYSADALVLLREHIPRYHSDPDAKFRHEVLGHTKTMAGRIYGALAVLRRTAAQRRAVTAVGWTGEVRSTGEGKSSPGEQARLPILPPYPNVEVLQDSLDRHDEFLGWYITFLRNELTPTASYQRHITALKATATILTLGKDTPGGPDGFNVTADSIFRDVTWIRSILDLTMDNFDDVREAATAVLASFPDNAISAPLAGERKGSGLTLHDILHEFCIRADSHASRTARADHADGAARARGLLCKWTKGSGATITFLRNVLDALEAKLSLAEEDLGRAAIGNPVHGAFASVR